MRAHVWIALAILVAGCSEAPVADDDPLLPDAKTTASTGAIAGVIVTEAIVPIAGANITLSDGTATASDDNGAFVFEDLAPGTYFLTITAPEYFEVQSSTIVAAGEVAKLRLVLQADPSPQPYHETLPFNGYAAAWLGIGGWAYDIFLGDATGVRACGTCVFNFTTSQTPETMILEAVWEPTISPGAADDMLLGYYMTLYVDGDLVDSWYIKSGDAVHVGPDLLGSGTEFEVSLYPDDVWPGIEQSYDLYVSNFYVQGAPEGWSFAAGDE